MSRLPALFPLLCLAFTVSTLALPAKRHHALEKRSTYTQDFDGSGDDHDASIQSWGYLTFTRLDTYDLSACEAWCDGISACAFINLYNEYNTDATYNPQFKCVAYATPHTAAEKTNFGGQQLLPPPAGTSYITDSVGYTSNAFANPTTPDGYSFVFGPTDGATDADGLMETHSLTFYDLQGCANLCTAAVDPSGDVCAYFNIWLGIENGNPSYNCALYSIPTDASTATNTGQGSIQVTNSRGYARILSLITDGGFEDPSSSNYWTIQGFCTIVQNGIGNTGTSSALISSSTDSSFLIYSQPLNTVPGQEYTLTFWTLVGDPIPFFVVWNSQYYTVPVTVVGWSQTSVNLIAAGDDQLSFTIGPNQPIALFLDDVSLVPLVPS